MNTYIRISLTTMLVGIIVERNGLTEQEAIAAFYRSEIARKMNGDNALLLQMSPYLIYELWNAEITLGDYRKSPYISAFI
jgi:hypothetical protein